MADHSKTSRPAMDLSAKTKREAFERWSTEYYDNDPDPGDQCVVGDALWHAFAAGWDLCETVKEPVGEGQTPTSWRYELDQSLGDAVWTVAYTNTVLSFLNAVSAAWGEPAQAASADEVLLIFMPFPKDLTRVRAKDGMRIEAQRRTQSGRKYIAGLSDTLEYLVAEAPRFIRRVQRAL